MRIPIAQRYEQTFSTTLGCLSAGLFILLVSVTVPIINTIWNLIFPFFLLASTILIARVFYFENKAAIFDLTSPTIFQTGLLVFHSSDHHCAVFFALKLSLCKFNKSVAQKAITILLKVLPSSTSFTLEWTPQRDWFVNFYMKFEKSSFLERAREMMDNVYGCFKKILEPQNARILNGEELLTHFSFGTPGSLRQITINGRATLGLKTDTTQHKIALAVADLAQNELPERLFTAFNPSQSIRLLVPFKKDETVLRISKLLFAVSDKTNETQDSKNDRHSLISFANISSSKSIRNLGNVLTRNLVPDKNEFSDLRCGVDLIVNLLSTAQQSWERNPIDDKASLYQDINPLEWRRTLSHFFSKLKIPFETNIQIFVEELPWRIDAKAGNLLFSIISNPVETQLNWLLEKIKTSIIANAQTEIVFLLTKPSMKKRLQNHFSSTQPKQRVHIVRAIEDLENLLKHYKNQIITHQESVAQVS